MTLKKKIVKLAKTKTAKDFALRNLDILNARGIIILGVYNTCTHNCVYCYANGFYAYRGKPKSMHDKLDGEIYDRKIERLFDY